MGNMCLRDREKLSQSKNIVVYPSPMTKQKSGFSPDKNITLLHLTPKRNKRHLVQLKMKKLIEYDQKSTDSFSPKYISTLNKKKLQKIDSEEDLVKISWSSISKQRIRSPSRSPYSGTFDPENQLQFYDVFFDYLFVIEPNLELYFDGINNKVEFMARVMGGLVKYDLTDKKLQKKLTDVHKEIPQKNIIAVGRAILLTVKKMTPSLNEDKIKIMDAWSKKIDDFYGIVLHSKK